MAILIAWDGLSRQVRPALMRLGVALGLACAMGAQGSTESPSQLSSDPVDHVVARASFVDAEGTLRVDEVEGAAFRPASALLARGYQKDVTWLRLDVRRRGDRDLMLVVAHPYLDDVRVYTRTESGRWLERRGGDRLPFSGREVPITDFAWRLAAPSPDADPDALERLYVRVATTSTTLVRARVLTADAATVAEAGKHGMVAFLVTIHLMLVLATLVRGVVTRDPLWYFAMLTQLSAIAAVLSSHGFVAKFVWPDRPLWCDNLVSLAACLHLAAANLYLYRFVSVYRAPRWARFLVISSVLALPLMLYWIATGQPQSAVKLNVQFLFVGSFWSLAIPWVMTFEDKLTAYMTRFTYTVLLVQLVFLTGPLLGLAFNDLFSSYGGNLGSLGLGIMTYAILARRDYLRNRHYQTVEAAAHDAQTRLAWANERRQEASSFLDMLLHELKNPLAAIRFATANLRRGRDADVHATERLDAIHASVDSIDAVLERTRMAGRVEHGRTVIQPGEMELTASLREWLGQRPEADQSRLRVVVPPALPIRADAFLVRTIFDNLIDNALAYSPAGSPVDAQLLVSDPGRLTFRVGNAPGRAGRPDVEKVFTKYYRAEGAHGRSGAGLGLFLVRSLARMIDGDVVLVPDAERVVFEVSLPC